MKQSMKNEADLLNLINAMQVQLIALDKKVDTLISRSMPETKQLPKPTTNISSTSTKPNDRNNTRPMYKVICADCKIECTIPFKPSGDRPVYCKDCFSRRKVISMSGMKVNDAPKEINTPQAPITDVSSEQPKARKKTVTVKKAVAKKKPAAKKSKSKSR